jgi:hypothetical protein
MPKRMSLLRPLERHLEAETRRRKRSTRVLREKVVQHFGAPSPSSDYATLEASIKAAMKWRNRG